MMPLVVADKVVVVSGGAALTAAACTHRPKTLASIVSVTSPYVHPRSIPLPRLTVL